jgi:hypothetical protein
LIINIVDTFNLFWGIGVATAYKLNTKETINFLPNSAKKPFSNIVDGLDNNFFFADAL